MEIKVKVIISHNKGGSGETEIFDWPFPMPEKEESLMITELEKITNVVFYNSERQNDNAVLVKMRDLDWVYYAYRNFRVSEDNIPYIELTFEQIDE